VAPPPGTLRVGRYFAALLALLALLYLVVFFPGNRHKPKLGIDLVGGLRVVFTAVPPAGSPTPSSAQMTQARQIMEDRINTTGVTGATVVVQGTNQLVIEIPNGTTTDVNRLGHAAILNFRGLLTPEQQLACAGSSPVGGTAFVLPGSAKVTPAAVSAAFQQAGLPLTRTPQLVGKAKAQILVTVRDTASTSGGVITFKEGVSAAKVKTVSAAVAKTLSLKAADVQSAPLCAADPFASIIAADQKQPAAKQAHLAALLHPDVQAGEFGLNAEFCKSPGSPAMPTVKVKGKKVTPACTGFAELPASVQTQIKSAIQKFDCSSAQTELDSPGRYYIACGSSGGVDLFGHVVVRGTDVDSASAQAPSTNGQGLAQWAVNLNLGGSGADKWSAWTSKYNTTKAEYSAAKDATGPTQCGTSSQPCSLWVGFTLDGQVLSLPITNGSLSTQTQVTGSFTESSAKQLAQELNYGKLPISFRAEENNHVSATLGKSQLNAAFLAGGIGLVLVVIYSLIYYRALGLVTIASLIVSAGLTYAMLVILSKQIGFTLDLAGIAGFIVALGITADSFVVFFERIKDEVHEGRSLRVAVPRAWVRARRTILSADTVSFLAAAILYYFASADVKGFAFTLGMSTILDLVVVFLFTHPMVSLLSRSAAFGSARFSGLSNVRSGGIVRSEDDPEGRKAARTARTRKTSGAAQPIAAPSATVTLEKDDVDGADATAGADTEPQNDAYEPANDAADDTPRRRTTPQAGTAAERAAQRRARMREQGKGEN